MPQFVRLLLLWLCSKCAGLSLQSTLSKELGVRFHGIEIKDDEFGGRGLYATRELDNGEVLAIIPWSSVIHGDVSLSNDEQRVSIAIILALARSGEGSIEHQAFAATLSWDLAEWHPLAKAIRDGTDDPTIDHMARGAFAATERVMKSTGLTKDFCLEAILAVSTRAFDLSHIVPGCSAALVPGAEIANHPSRSVVTPRFIQVPVCEAVIGTCLLPDSLPLEPGHYPNSICIRAPHSSSYIQPGDQLFNWYSNAGVGEQDLDKYRKLRTTFLTQYGFDPF